MPTATVWFLTVFLAGWLGLYVWATRGWPLVGDASIIQYVAFLMSHGFAPYRQIIEMNFPGSYLVQWLEMHALGGGAVAWRLFDFLLLALAGAAAVLIARPYGWFAGFAAAALFALIHGQDGIALSGERDLIVTVLFAWAYAFLFAALRCHRADHAKRRLTLIFLALLACGISATMKPVAAPAGPILLVLAALRLRHEKRSCRGTLLVGSLGFLLPLAAAAIYLEHVGATEAFFSTMAGLARYYSGLYHKPIGFLLSHCAAPVGPLAALWIVVAIIRRQWSWEKWMLAGGTAYGLAYYLVQARGFPYYRYPLLFFLLLAIALDFKDILREQPRRRSLAMAAAVGSIYAIFFLAPRSALKAASYDGKNQEFITMLSSDLDRIAGSSLPGGNLSGRVQCFDTTAGCINTLYRMRLVQATGFLYDCYAYAPRGKTMMATVDRYRHRFRAALEKSAPRILVVTNQYCQQGPDTYAKLKRWPWLDQWIGTNYQLAVERMPPDKVRWWSRAAEPYGYRIYLRR